MSVIAPDGGVSVWLKPVQVWMIVFLFAAIAGWSGRGAVRGRVLRSLVWVGVLSALAVVVWAWVGVLPFSGVLGRLAIGGGLVWLVGYRGWTGVLPALIIRSRQRGRLQTMAWDEDARDARRLKWSRVIYDRTRAIAPYLESEAETYWLARTDSFISRTRLGIMRRQMCDVAIPRDLMLRHLLVLGATGAGKTRTAIQPLLEQQIARGLGLLALQFKHDELFYRGVFEAVARAHREEECVYLSLRSDDDARTATWNPLAWPRREEIAESMVHAIIDDVVPLRYFAAQNLDGLSIILDAATRKGEALSVPRLAGLLAETGHSGAGRPLLAYLRPFPELRMRAQKVRWDHASELKMMAARLARFHALTPSPARRVLDLGVALQRRQVVLVNLDATAFPQAARYVGRLLIAFLSAAYSSLRRTEDDPLYLVALDEFGPVAGPHLSSVLGTARGFGVGLVLATQSLADVRIAGQREAAGALAAQIVENVGTQVVFGLRNPDEAQWWSRASGTILRDYATETLLGARAGGEVGGRLVVSVRESGAVSANKLLFAPRSKAFVWVPSRRCLRRPGGRSLLGGRDVDRRELILANFALPPNPAPWPEIAGGGIGSPRDESVEVQSPSVAPPEGSAAPEPMERQLSSSPQVLPAGILGSTLRSGPVWDAGSGTETKLQGGSGSDGIDSEAGNPGGS